MQILLVIYLFVSYFLFGFRWVSCTQCVFGIMRGEKRLNTHTRFHIHYIESMRILSLCESRTVCNHFTARFFMLVCTAHHTFNMLTLSYVCVHKQGNERCDENHHK